MKKNHAAINCGTKKCDCVALHMCYRHLTLSLTTVKSWMDWGYM